MKMLKQALAILILLTVGGAYCQLNMYLVNGTWWFNRYLPDDKNGPNFTCVKTSIKALSDWEGLGNYTFNTNGQPSKMLCFGTSHDNSTFFLYKYLPLENDSRKRLCAYTKVEVYPELKAIRTYMNCNGFLVGRMCLSRSPNTSEGVAKLCSIDDGYIEINNNKC